MFIKEMEVTVPLFYKIDFFKTLLIKYKILFSVFLKYADDFNYIWYCKTIYMKIKRPFKITSPIIPVLILVVAQK
jgi:hypothetical protein